MSIYLIDLTKTSIVGRFEDADTAAIAGENHLAGGYYVGGGDDLAKWKRDELRTILANLGQRVSANWPKEQFIERIVTLADTAEFEPLMKEEEPENPARVKREGVRCWKRPQKEGVTREMWALCDSMAGAKRKEVLAAAAAMGLNANMAKTQFGRWQNRCEGE